MQYKTLSVDGLSYELVNKAFRSPVLQHARERLTQAPASVYARSLRIVSLMSGRPTPNPSERAVSTNPVPPSSVARRAAPIRSTAWSNSKSGSASSPDESAIESPAIPVAAARFTFAATWLGESRGSFRRGAVS